MKRKIMITGVCGMDGSLLADKYLERMDTVIGIDRWNPTGEYPNLKNAFYYKKFNLVTGDITEHEFIVNLIKKYKPDIFFNMAAISLVPESFKIPTRIFNVNTMSVISILEAIRLYSPKTRFYQASTSEQIGDNTKVPQNTDSKMLPNSPYAISKLASYHLVRMYRKAYGLFAVNGMLWNHEGPRRGKTFVTRKISKAVARISLGKQDILELGNMESYRDWGNAEEYVEAMMKMMEANEPDDYAVATGKCHQVLDFVNEAFKVVGIKLKWTGKGKHLTGTDSVGNVLVRVNEEFYRPTEVIKLKGDYSKIKKKLGWKPETSFKDLVRMMVEHDLDEELENGN